MSTNPTNLEQQNQTEQQNKAPVSSIRTHSGFTLWLDGLRCKLTVHAWRRRTKKARRHHSFRQVLARVPHANLIGDALYMIGFRTRLISHIRSSSTTAIRIVMVPLEIKQ